MPSIYVLKDPRDVSTVYHVGQTVRSLASRLAGHIRKSGTSQAPLGLWMSKIIDQDLVPVIEKIEVVSELEAKTREKFWIEKLSAEGHPLKNIIHMEKGEFKGRKSLTEEELQEMLDVLREKTLSQTEIALRFGVSVNTVSKMFHLHVAEGDERYAHFLPDGTKATVKKLTDEQVIEIKRQLGEGIPQRKIAEQFHVSQITVSHISRGETWAHIPGPKGKPGHGANHPHAKLNEEKVRDIRALISEGQSLRSIGRAFGVDKAIIGKIRDRRLWAHVE